MYLRSYRVVRRGDGRALCPYTRRVAQQDVGKLLARELQGILARVKGLGGELSPNQLSLVAEGIYTTE